MNKYNTKRTWDSVVVVRRRRPMTSQRKPVKNKVAQGCI